MILHCQSAGFDVFVLEGFKDVAVFFENGLKIIVFINRFSTLVLEKALIRGQQFAKITFSYGSLGNFVITDADLSRLYLITAYYRFADGSEALAPKTFRATPGAAFEIGYSFIEGYLPDVKNISGKINDSDTEIVFTYHPGAGSSDSADNSDGTDDKPGKKSGAAKAR